MSKIVLGEHSFDLNAKSWRAMVHRDVSVFSVAEYVKLLFWIVAFKSYFLMKYILQFILYPKEMAKQLYSMFHCLVYISCTQCVYI